MKKKRTISKAEMQISEAIPKFECDLKVEDFGNTNSRLILRSL
jgi:hypothetical protein